MPARSLRPKRRRFIETGTDRVVAAAVVVAVATVLLLTAFLGPAFSLRLPGTGGWIYVVVVLSLLWLCLHSLFGSQK